MNAPRETTEHQAVQTIVAEYNRISASLAETPGKHRPRFSQVVARTYDSMDWRVGFLLGTDFAEKQWRPVIRGHAGTGDIIAPIRELSYATAPATTTDAAAVAEALVKIRGYFMPSAQSRSSKRLRYKDRLSTSETRGRSSRSRPIGSNAA